MLAAGIAPPNAEGEDCTSWTIHDAGTFSEADLCLPDADGYVISFNSSPYDGEIGWSLIDADGNVALSGGAPGTYDTCPTADCDAANSWDFHMTDTYGNGWDCVTADISDCDGNVLAAGVAPPDFQGEDCTLITFLLVGLTFSNILFMGLGLDSLFFTLLSLLIGFRVDF